MTVWWLSFAGDEGFRGVAIVRADGFLDAVVAARILGCNPGGECRGFDLPPEAWEALKEDERAVLLQRDRLMQLDSRFGVADLEDCQT